MSFSNPLILHVQRAGPAVDDRAAWLGHAGFREAHAGFEDNLVPVLADLQPDLLLLHAGPVLSDALDLCRLLQSHPEHRHRLRVMLSDRRDAESRAAALNHGADGYLEEPADPDDVIATVRALLRRAATDFDRHAFMRQVLDTDPNFIFAKDEHGRFTLVNRAVAECYGTTVEQLIGKTDADFNARSEEVRWFRTHDQEVMETLNERRIAEEVITDAAGRRRWLQTVKRPIVNEEGRAVQVLGVSTDITQRKRVEESLARQLDLNRAITENSTQALFLLDARGQCTVMNRAAEAMFGFSPSEIGDGPLHDQLHRHRLARSTDACVLRRALAEARPLREHEDVLLRRTGDCFPVLVAASPIMENGRLVSTVMEVRDVTEQVRSRHELALVKDQLQLILRSAGEGIYGLDLGGRAVFVNPAGAAMFGYREHDLLGRDLLRLLSVPRGDGTPSPGKPPALSAVLQDGTTRYVHDETFWDKEGHPRAVAYTCSPIIEGHGVTGAVMVVRDMTESRRVQEALRQSEERLRLALAAGHMDAWDIDLSTSRPDEEGEARGLADQRGDGMAPSLRTFLDRVHPEDRAAVLRRVQEAIERGEFHQEFRITRPDGQIRWLVSRGLVLTDANNRLERLVGIDFDMTDRKALEERLRSFTLELEWRVAERTRELEQSQQRLRALATELNLTEQRERKRLATDLHDYLAQLLVLVRLKLGQIRRTKSVAEDTAKLLQETEGVINEALAYTRTLVTQLSPPVLRDFGLPAALTWLSQQMLRQELSVSVTQRVPDALPLPEDQAVLLFQSVRELLLNVKKHAGTCEAMVIMERAQDELRVTVRDHGKGMSPDSAASDGPSSALSSQFGLFSINERMRAVGGRFECESMPGCGTIARLVLPLPAEDVQPSAARQDVPLDGERSHDEGSSPGESRATRPSAAPVRVLLADDHAMIREGLRGLLKEHEDVEVVGEAGNGEEAVAFADRLRPHVVIMDLNMPGVDGIEATRRIKAAFRSVAVIGLSVNGSQEVARAMLASGADAFLSKEAAGEQVYRTIRELTGRG